MQSVHPYQKKIKIPQSCGFKTVVTSRPRQQLIHRHVIDTALLYRREHGQKFKLKVLAKAVLK